jgi:hypothetical protein
MIKTIQYKDTLYPAMQAEGFASQFAIPYAKHFCKGVGVDVGCNRIEWTFPGATPIDPVIDPQYDATNFPPKLFDLDYIFSSHCLEHLDNWVKVLDYWTYKLKSGGVLFLYLPDYSQEYWRPWNNRKHLNIFTPQIIEDYMKDSGYKNIFKSNVDLNNAFMIVGEKI